MKRLFSLLKPFDYLIILGVIALSFLPNILTFYHYQGLNKSEVVSQATELSSTKETPASSSAYALIKIDGKEVDRFDLSEDAPHEEKTYYPHPGQYNIIERDGKRIRVREDNSPDQIAVKTSWVGRPGQVSICLPHGLIIEIHGERSTGGRTDTSQSNNASSSQEEELVLPK